jgi:hypothetical protein
MLILDGLVPEIWRRKLKEKLNSLFFAINFWQLGFENTCGISHSSLKIRPWVISLLTFLASCSGKFSRLAEPFLCLA